VRRCASERPPSTASFGSRSTIMVTAGSVGAPPMPGWAASGCVWSSGSPRAGA
jgi:hypothetical protein